MCRRTVRETLNRTVREIGFGDAADLFNATTVNTTADASGKWMVRLPSQKASNTPLTLSVRGNNEVLITDILVGDVWLGTGQSNMDWVVKGSDGKDKVLNSHGSEYKGIRLFKVAEAGSDQPLGEVTGRWTDAGKQNVLDFSATLFFFGDSLKKRQPDVPLGLIRSSIGATNAFSWLPNEIRDNDPSTSYLRQWWANATKSWSPEKQEQRDKEFADYQSRLAEYRARNENPDSLKKPGELMGPRYSRRPSAFYNGMIAPLQPFSIRGMIWYQGEWDAKKDWVKVYHGTFLALAKSWRNHWAQAAGTHGAGDFPIYVVQLPSRIPGDGDYWPFMREVQQQIAADLPNSGFVTTFDLNDGKELHPLEKVGIGERLANLALNKEYGRPVPFHGPLFREAVVSGGRSWFVSTWARNPRKAPTASPCGIFNLRGATVSTTRPPRSSTPPIWKSARLRSDPLSP